jgi:hypothetical protein
LRGSIYERVSVVVILPTVSYRPGRARPLAA